MRIPIAEDEEDIRAMYDRILADRGHEAFVTCDGEECLKIYQEKVQDHYNGKASPYFDAVVLDYRMPKKDGLQAAREILEINPDQRIIFASAYVKETLTESVKELRRVVELMQKPFSMSTLVDVVENKEAYQGLKQIMTRLKGIEQTGVDLTADQVRELFEDLRKIQKYRY